MSDLATQRRIAAEVLKCGINRIWMDPERKADIEAAISRADVRALIEQGVIAARQKQGVSRGRARLRALKKAYGHRKGPGSRKGAGGARTPPKRRWIQRVRAQRRVLRELRAEGSLDRHQYRILYRKSAGGEFRSVAHLKAHIGSATERRT
ncbi:MAG: 50S ribosomal protein L19e [Methanomicrobiales archaeon]|nr:50S ribosomal protein L19e [Methanomicrobiales archaeon]MDI6875938.1 50S ribosomal protein L19e [Methanomicrobiales archaeon]